MKRTVGVVGWIMLLLGCGPGRDRQERARLSLADMLGGADTAGYARATETRPFDFPKDHGPHPRFRTEWWYVTGNLTATTGQAFGFQFTIFRNALSARTPQTESAWGTNQAYMAHFTVTDVSGGEFFAYERFARGAVGLAGAASEPFRAWVGDWTLEATSPETFPLRLHAVEDDVELHLDLERGKPGVLQGDEGLSQKGPAAGNASFYYSHTRLPASGTIVVASDTLAVAGTAWLDREWGTSALAEGQVGWDWFALQLEDGWDLMVYRLRRADGSADPRSDGVLVDPSGARVPLSWGTGVVLESTSTWASPIDGAVYPSGWRLRIPARGWDLTVDPMIAGQELDLTFRYWEGAVRVTGTGEGGAPVTGRGYVELTGYAGDAPAR